MIEGWVCLAVVGLLVLALALRRLPHGPSRRPRRRGGGVYQSRRVVRSSPGGRHFPVSNTDPGRACWSYIWWRVPEHRRPREFRPPHMQGDPRLPDPYRVGGPLYSRPLYVGESWDPDAREGEHSRESDWYSHTVGPPTLQRHVNKQAARRREWYLIGELDPIHNRRRPRGWVRSTGGRLWNGSHPDAALRSPSWP
jgi:hypothetical protein